MGTLFVRSLPVECVIGVHAFERASRQQLLISLTLEMDFSRAAATDDVEHALDYVLLTERVSTFAAAGEFALIETLAERLADELFRPPIDALEVEVTKPAALASTREVGVRVTRGSHGR